MNEPKEIEKFIETMLSPVEELHPINDLDFIETVFDLAFGDDAIHKGFSREEVLLKLREFSDDATGEYKSNPA